LVVVSPEGTVVDVARQITASGSGHTEALEKLSGNMSRFGITGVSPGALLIIVLAWILALGVPVALPELPAKAQVAVAGELATVPLAVAITGYLLKRKDDDK